MEYNTAAILNHLAKAGIKPGSVVKADNGNARLQTEPIVEDDGAVICTVIYTTGRFKGLMTSNFHLNEFLRKIK